MLVVTWFGLALFGSAATQPNMPDRVGNQQWFDLREAVEEGKLLAGDYFGSAVSLSGSRAVVGASRHDAVADVAGAVYVYEFDGISWSIMQKLTADDGAANDQFGYAVSILDDRIMVGAFRGDDSGDSGAVYVFEFNGSVWSQTQKLIASDGGNSDWFGFSLSL